MLNKVPAVLRVGVYATAALVGAAVLVIGVRQGLPRARMISHIRLFFRAGTGRSRTVLSAVLMGILFHPGQDPSRVYYGTDTRALPLMVGALLAFAWPLEQITGRASRSASLILDTLAIVAIGGLLLTMHARHDYDTFLYRGGFVMAAILAAVLVATAANSASSVARVLGRQPLPSPFLTPGLPS